MKRVETNPLHAWTAARRGVTSSVVPQSAAGKDVDHARSLPQEFCDDVVRVARNREPGQRLSAIAKDFGISESCLTNWMRQADVEDGARPGKTRDESSELRDARKRIRLLEQENEVLRRAAAYLSQANLPGKGSTRS